MMPAWAALTIGTLLCLGEAVLLQALHIDRFAFQWWIPMAVWLSMQKDWGTSAMVLAMLFLPIEWTAGGRMGIVSFGLILPFLLVRLSGLSVGSVSIVTHSIIGAGFALLHNVSMVGLLFVLDPDSRMIGAILWNTGASMLVCAVCTPILLRLFSQLETWFVPQRGAGVRMR